MAGYEFGDIECWETGWRFYVGEIGSGEARSLMGELQYWVRSVRGETAPAHRLFPAWLPECLPRRMHGIVDDLRHAG